MLFDFASQKREWLKIFNKKFARFCKNTPFSLGFDSTSESQILLYVHSNGRQYIHRIAIDVSKDVSAFIRELRDQLEHYYPTFQVEYVTEEEPTNEEIQSLIIRGYSFEKAVEYRKKHHYTHTYRVEKVFNDQNSLQLHNITTGKFYIAYCNMPVLIFLERINQSPRLEAKTFRDLLEVLKEKETEK